MSAPTTVSGVLDAAADHITEYGWMQGRSFNEDGRCCALRAIAHVDPGRYGEMSLRYRAGLAMRAAFASGGYADAAAVIDWNDAEDRTADEVIAKLREVAASEREAGR